METRIYAIISDMNQAAQKLSRETGVFSGAVEKTRTAAEKLIAGWEGDAQAAFVREQAEAFSYYTQMAQLVEKHIEKIRSAATSYTDADNRGAQLLRRA